MIDKIILKNPGETPERVDVHVGGAVMTFTRLQDEWRPESDLDLLVLDTCSAAEPRSQFVREFYEKIQELFA